ncbi:MAG: ATP cone domain-containing protein [Candidatus Brennerbacteria bacterium]
MANMVIKRDGSKQLFDAEKVKNAIANAAREAGHDDAKVVEIVAQVSEGVLALAGGVEEITTAELKMKTLADLDTIAPEVSAAWRKHDLEKKGVSA